MDARIIDPETGAELGPNRPGEIVMNCPMQFEGYWNKPEATAETVVDGWLHTGDIGYLDDDGYLYITDRAKDMIIRGGENIYPREIEEYLYTHPDVADVQVIGVPSARYGEEVMAWVRLREGTTLSNDDLDAYCRGKIATYKIPRYWKMVDGFPMTVTGKIQKYRIRELAIQELHLEEASRIETA